MTERLTDNTLILPLFHQMSESEQARVIEVLLACSSVSLTWCRCCWSPRVVWLGRSSAVVDSLPDLNVVGIVDDDPSLHGTFRAWRARCRPGCGGHLVPRRAAAHLCRSRQSAERIVARLGRPRRDRRAVRNRDRRVVRVPGSCSIGSGSIVLAHTALTADVRGRPARRGHAERDVDPRQPDRRLCDDLRWGFAGRRSGGRAGCVSGNERVAYAKTSKSAPQLCSAWVPCS